MVANILNSFSGKRLIVLVLAFVILFVFIFFQRADLSDSDIKVSIVGPDSFRAETAVEFEVKVKNDSSFDLEDVVFFVKIPEFIVFSDSRNGAKRVSEKSIEVGSVGSGEEIIKKIELLSLEAGVSGVVNARAEYAPSNLQGRFERRASRDITVSSLPLTVIFDVPEKAVDGQKIEGAAHFVRNEKIESLPIFAKLVAPPGFDFIEREPIPYKENLWKFDEIESGKSYEIKFNGIVRGGGDETKEFELLFGHIRDDGSFAAQYRAVASVGISSSPMDFEIKAEGEEGEDERVASGGEEITFSIKYGNKSGVDIEDLKITARFEGDIFDLDAINAGSGFFNRNTRTIIWDENFLDSLSRLRKNDTGEVTFKLTLKDSFIPKNYKDKNIQGVVNASIESLNAPLALRGLSVRAEDAAVIKISTSLGLFTRGYYYEGPFSNSGPMPPKVGEKTTYTILWQITNTTNDIRETVVEAPLPGNIDFEGVVYPASSGFRYNESSHSVRWDLGVLSSGVGSIFSVETIAFKVSVTPDESMRGNAFTLIEQSKISGTDTFTGEFMEDFAPPVSSSLPDDIGVGQGDGVVR